MNVLSLFDGISCGRVALERAGIEVDNYYASEVDKNAIAITQRNYPDTIQLGDVKTVNIKDLKHISLLIGGSPCQGFSIAGNQLNFNDPRSALFFDYWRILKELNPKYFLLENVKMKKEFQDIISQHLGVEPIEINSGLVSAQSRKRLYWTNIPGITQPIDKKIMLNEILEDEVDEKFYISTDKAIQICDIEAKKGKIAYIGTDSQGNRIYSIHDKSVTISALGGGWGAKTGLYWIPCITPDRVNKRQNGQRFKPSNAKFYTLTAQDNHGVLAHGQIRKLTPIECERLQTLSDNYTKLEGITDSNRIKALGNGWTVDVVSHIFSNMDAVKAIKEAV